MGSVCSSQRHKVSQDGIQDDNLEAGPGIDLYIYMINICTIELH